MRPIVLLAFVAFGIFMGLYGGLKKPKKIWWKAFVIIYISIGIAFSLIPPLGSGTNEAIYVAELPNEKIVPLDFVPLSNHYETLDNGILFQATIPDHIFSKLPSEKAEIPKFKMKFIGDEKEFERIKNAKEVIANSYWDKEQNLFVIEKVIHIDPPFVFPYLPQLKQRIRNLNFHVPMSWVGTIAFLISMIFSIRFLRKKQYDFTLDILASSSAAIGLLYIILATVTGMIWARFDWGTYWNNDPKQIAILVVLIIYLAYFLLRSSIDSKDKKAKLSAVYSIFAFITSLFSLFIIPRQFASLHPGAKGDETVGPVLDTSTGMLDSELALAYYVSLSGFIIIYFWLFSLLTRYKILEEKVKHD